MAPTAQIVRLDDVAPSPWKNGGGQTRELCLRPELGPWRVRVSVAEIEKDGPFSSFPGIDRWFAVLSGRGVALRFGSEETILAPESEPIRFEGETAPFCRLIDGPTRDLNLMIADGEGTMLAARPGLAWGGPFRERGLFAKTALRLLPERGEPIELAPGTLLWQSESTSGPWEVVPISEGDPPVGFWLGFSPAESRVSS